MKKWSFLFILILFLSTATTVEAAKSRVWGKKMIVPSASANKLSITAKLTGWKQYLDINFKGVSSTKGITYELIYTSNGVDQGAGGSVSSAGGNVSKSLFLGSCSHGACVAHKNISNVWLSVNYQTTSGQAVTKNYKVRY